MNTLKTMMVVGALLASANACNAAPPTASVSKPPDANVKLVLPSEAEAADAFAEMMGSPEIRAQMTVKLGTCIRVVDAEHTGQVACTVSVKLGAGTSETQADFFKNGKKWIAQPSASQDQLPFPDPKLH